MRNNRNTLLDIGMNLDRIGSWTTEEYSSKTKRIEMFFRQTSDDLKKIETNLMPTPQSRLAIKRFKQEYPIIESSVLNSTKPNLVISERIITWGNILTHKANLLSD